MVPCSELWDKADMLGFRFPCGVSVPSPNRQDTVRPRQHCGENETILVKCLRRSSNYTGLYFLPPPPLPGSSRVQEAGKTRSYRPCAEEETGMHTGRRTTLKVITDRTWRGQDLSPVVLIPSPAKFLARATKLRG